MRPIQLRISRDACRHSRELWPLFAQISLRLGDRRLSADSVRRGAGIDDSSILERFREKVGLSVTDYIDHRRQETVVRLVYTSDLPLEDIASMMGYRIEYAVSNIVRMWSRGRWSPADLRRAWRESGFDPVILRWVERGEATPEQAEQVLEKLKRMRLRIERRCEGWQGLRPKKVKARAPPASRRRESRVLLISRLDRPPSEMKRPDLGASAWS